MEFVFKEWKENWTPSLIERNFDISKILPKKIKKIITFTGSRRSGKTFLMFQSINALSKSVDKDSIFYINFEDERIEKTVDTLTNLIPKLIELYGSRDYYLFLDEIQIMPSWDEWLRRVYDNYRNFHFFVSGSSSKLSLREIPRALRGRTLNHEVFPLSFKEFLRFKEIELEKNWYHSEKKLSMIKRKLKEYMLYGGLPEVVLEDEVSNKKRLLQEYFRTIVALDLGERYKIINLSLLSDLLKLMLNSTIFSVNKVYNILKSSGRKVGKESLINYSKYADESYFAFYLPLFSYKIKDQMQYLRKIYFVDNGFINFVGLKFSKNLGRLYENMIFLELKRREERNPLKEIFYWKNQQHEEVDFVIKNSMKIEQLIQVCYNLSDVETKERETRALLKASKELGCNKLLIITENYEAEEDISWFGIKRKISFLPLWRMLLKDS